MKKPRRVLVDIQVDMFGYSVYVMTGTSEGDARKFMKKVGVPSHECDLFTLGDGSYAIHLNTQCHGSFILIPEFKDSAHGISVLVHELSHATRALMDYCNLVEPKECNEVEAYILGYLVQKCLMELFTGKKIPGQPRKK